MPIPYKLVYLTPAAEDFEEIVKYHISEVGAESAKKIYLTMRTELARLADFPLLGQMHSDPILAMQQYRRLILTKTYVAVYKVIDDTIYIYRIVNGKTDYPKLLK